MFEIEKTMYDKRLKNSLKKNTLKKKMKNLFMYHKVIINVDKTKNIIFIFQEA